MAGDWLNRALRFARAWQRAMRPAHPRWFVLSSQIRPAVGRSCLPLSLSNAGKLAGALGVPLRPSGCMAVTADWCGERFGTHCSHSCLDCLNNHYLSTYSYFWCAFLFGEGFCAKTVLYFLFLESNWLSTSQTSVLCGFSVLSTQIELTMAWPRGWARHWPPECLHTTWKRLPRFFSLLWWATQWNRWSLAALAWGEHGTKRMCPGFLLSSWGGEDEKVGPEEKRVLYI